MPASTKTSIQVSDVEVHLYGDTAIVTLHERYTHSGEKIEGLNLSGQSVTVTDTFIKRDGQWKAIAGVMTPRAALPAAFYRAVQQR
jgi:hypothetical protein